MSDHRLLYADPGDVPRLIGRAAHQTDASMVSMVPDGAPSRRGTSSCSSSGPAWRQCRVVSGSINLHSLLVPATGKQDWGHSRVTAASVRCHPNRLLNPYFILSVNEHDQRLYVVPSRSRTTLSALSSWRYNHVFADIPLAFFAFLPGRDSLTIVLPLGPVHLLLFLLVVNIKLVWLRRLCVNAREGKNVFFSEGILFVFVVCC